jgi:hypothetical protein
LEHTTQQNTQVCIPKENSYIQGGLKDLLIESSVYAAGSVEQMMTGKQFNRALTLVYEALSSLWLSAFFEWCRENDILTAHKDKLSPVLASPRSCIHGRFNQQIFQSTITPKFTN